MWGGTLPTWVNCFESYNPLLYPDHLTNSLLLALRLLASYEPRSSALYLFPMGTDTKYIPRIVYPGTFHLRQRAPA